jgi:nitrite reductase/ring-hydroxylating ferredoxin subunit
VTDRVFVQVPNLQDLPQQGFKAVHVHGRSVLVGRIANQPFAWIDRCPHAGAPLRIGKLKGEELTCAWPGWTFTLATGRAIPDHPAFRLTPIPVKIEDSQVFVAV